MSISRTNLLYLPEIRNNATDGIAANSTTGLVSIAVDDSTVTDLKDGDGNLLAGIINGNELNRNTSDNRRLLMDQGIVSNAIGAIGKVDLDADLVETQYIIEIDNRLGFLADPSGTRATPSFIDDDNIASYYLSLTTNPTYFSNATLTESAVLEGPAGYRLSLLVGASTNLNSSTYLFTQLGSTSQITPISDAVDLYHIDTTIRITGATTGFRVDIPIRFLKKQ